MVTQELIQNGGLYLVTVSTVGLFFNFSSIFNFSEISSFNILCFSKTVSNIFILSIYFGYIGMSYLLFEIIGPPGLNRYLNQATAYGLFAIGAVIQTMITVNRFMVVFWATMETPKYSNQVTVACLGVCWVGCVWLSVLPGYEDRCFLNSSLDHLGWSETPCTINIGQFLFFALLIIGIFSNFLNFLIARKLIISSKNRGINFEMSRKRRANTIRFFFQSLLQDWVYVVQMIICHYITKIFEKDTVGKFMSVMGTDVLVPVVDGIVMFSFHFCGKKNTSIPKKKIPKISFWNVWNNRKSSIWSVQFL